MRSEDVRRKLIARVWSILAQAYRNVTRNARRSGIALVAVGFGIIAMLLAAGFIEDILYGMREATIETHLGHIQITRPDYLDAGLAAPFEFLLPHGTAERKTVEETPGVQVLAPRLSFNGLISRGETTVSFVADGVEPEKESRLSKRLKIVSGERLGEADRKSVILGQGLATSLGARVGDTVVLVANTQKGGVNAAELTVRGIFSTVTKAYDDVALQLPLETAQRLLRIDGAHRWVVLLDRTENTEAVVAALNQRLDNKQFEIVPWTQLADFYNKTVMLFSRQVTVMKVIIAAIIVLSISNTMMMTVMERTGEVGTAMALGNTRRSILALFLAEGLLLGVGGALFGMLVGMTLAAAISHIGVPMPPPPGSTQGFIAKILVTPELMVQALFLAVFTALVASIYPAWKASRMPIVDALRHNR